MPVSDKVRLLYGVAILAAATAAGLIFQYLRRPRDPELQRRRLIDQQGRIIEGSIVDFEDGFVFYSWSWRGVEYEASQDLRSLPSARLEQAEIFAGPVSVKFLPRDPANSIVMSEEWNGFRQKVPR